jgi:hypothetical protein
MVPTYRVFRTSRCDVIKRRAPVYGYGSLLCSSTERYTAVTSNEHLKHQRLLAFTKLITQAISPHN